MKIMKIACALLMTAVISVSHAAVIHITDSSGKLLGANNVLVDGALYDVEFLDGTCTNLFNGCDEQSDFTFDTGPSVQLALIALWELVLVDTQAGLFFTRPDLTRGCDISFCLLTTPYEFINTPGLFQVKMLALASISDPSIPTFFSVDSDAELDTSILGEQVYARWTAHIEVNEPGTIILLSFGMAGLFLSRHRKKS